MDTNPEAGECDIQGAADWPEFLERAKQLPVRHRLFWLRFWPLIAAVNGILAFSGMLIWPDGSGVHLLLFLLVFWLTPLALMLWTLFSGVLLGRTPWWGRVAAGHGDRIIALWCARQSLLAQGVFCAAGLAWLWLMLATRQVVFYWSTSIAGVSALVDDFLRTLTLGLVATPEPVAVSASQAGAITGWETELLQYSYYWALWLTQVLALWVLVPAALLVVLVYGILRHRLAHWYEWNLALRQRFEAQRKPALVFRALQPEHATEELKHHDFPMTLGLPDEPGFAWQSGGDDSLPGACVYLGTADHTADMRKIEKHAHDVERWYIGAQSVPTGDLADLIQYHHECGGRPRLSVLLTRSGTEPIDALKLSWGAFIERNHLPVRVELIASAEVADGSQ